MFQRLRNLEKKFVETGKIRNLKELSKANLDELRNVWRNKRSWIIAKEIVSYLLTLSEDDKKSLRVWAKGANLENWKEDPIEELKA